MVDRNSMPITTDQSNSAFYLLSIASLCHGFLEHLKIVNKIFFSTGDSAVGVGAWSPAPEVEVPMGAAGVPSWARVGQSPAVHLHAAGALSWTLHPQGNSCLVNLCLVNR